MTKLQEIIKQYLDELHRIIEAARPNATHTGELSYRTPIDQFLRCLSRICVAKNDAVVVLEPKNQNLAGRPDWLIFQEGTLAVYGYVEAKGVSPEPIDTVKHTNQFKRYRELGHNLIVTDGLEFIFYLSNSAKEVCRVSLIDKASFHLPQWELSSEIEVFCHCINEFFSLPQAYSCSEKRLVELIALRTKYLAQDISDIEELNEDEACSEKERAEIQLLSRLKECLGCRNSREGKDQINLSDYLSQVIMFCLLFAHRTICCPSDSPDKKLKLIRNFAESEASHEGVLTPFRKIFSEIFRNTPTESAFLRIWIEECMQFLSYVRMDSEAHEAPDFHKLYEDFLHQYSPDIKIDYGAFYTPKELAEYLVALCNSICGFEFDTKSFFHKGSVVLDPCCGTGSFMEHVLRQSPRGAEYDMCGIEILPAPYMLAHYRLGRVRNELANSGVQTEIILANTLSDYVYSELPLPRSIVEDEYHKLNTQVEKPIQLIICNPPASDNYRPNVGKEFQRIGKLMEDFRPPSAHREGRSNLQKQISNPFMQFIRWSCDVIERSASDAMLAIVVPSDFLATPSYQYARRYMTEHFSSLWVVLFDSDLRVSGSHESGNLFCTRQGRAALVLCKDRSKNSIAINSYHWLDISQMPLSGKRTFLLNRTADMLKPFAEQCIDKDVDSQFAFIPRDEYDADLYRHYWPINDSNADEAVFISQISGLKLAPTSLFQCPDRGILNRRTRDLAGDMSDLELRQLYFAGQSKPPSKEGLNNFRAKVREMGWSSASKRQDIANCIKPYWFRPFVQSYVIENDALFASLRSMKNSGLRDRPELRDAYHYANVKGFALAHSPKHLDTELRPFVSFCWGLPDNDLCARGNGHIHNNYCWDKKERKLKSNINSRLTRAVSAILCLDSSACEDSILFYCYAFLSSTVYLDKFRGALFTATDNRNRPRIPMSADGRLFKRLASLGYLLARLEHPDAAIRMRLGDAGNVSTYDLPQDFKLNLVSFNEQNARVILHGEAGEISVPCRKEVYETSISGYHIVEQWVRLHSYRYKRKIFDKQDLAAFLDLINRLSCRFVILEHINQAAGLILSVGATQLICPTEIS